MAAAARHARKRRNPQFSLGLENRNRRVFQKEQEKGSASTSPSPPRRLAWEQQRSSRRRFRQSPAPGRPATSCPAGGASPGKPTLEGGGHRKGGPNHRQWESGDIAKWENKTANFERGGLAYGEGRRRIWSRRRGGQRRPWDRRPPPSPSTRLGLDFAGGGEISL